MNVVGRQEAVLNMFFSLQVYTCRPETIKMGFIFCHTMYFFLSIVWCSLEWLALHHHWKTSAKNQGVVLGTQSLYYRLTDLQGSPVPPIITHAAFSCLWFCQSWMFGFRLAMLDICLQAELFSVVYFPPSKYLTGLPWPNKYLESYSHHFPGLGLSNTEENLSISNDPQKEWKH